jgi:hypothetical protein
MRRPVAPRGSRRPSWARSGAVAVSRLRPLERCHSTRGCAHWPAPILTAISHGIRTRSPTTGLEVAHTVSTYGFGQHVDKGSCGCRHHLCARIVNAEGVFNRAEQMALSRAGWPAVGELTVRPQLGAAHPGADRTLETLAASRTVALSRAAAERIARHSRGDVRRAIGALNHLEAVSTWRHGPTRLPWIADFARRPAW